MGNQNRHFFGFHQIHLAQVSKNAPKPTICWKKNEIRRHKPRSSNLRIASKFTRKKKLYQKCLYNIFQLKKKNIFFGRVAAGTNQMEVSARFDAIEATAWWEQMRGLVDGF